MLIRNSFIFRIVPSSSNSIMDEKPTISEARIAHIFLSRFINISKDLIITSANLKGFKKNSEEIKRKINKITKKRISSQPQGYPTGGSTFKNDKKYKAWQLINKLGLKDLRCGDAVISDQHNNFMINKGKAKASDFENLGEIIIEKVLNEFGIKLEWEIQILGQNG